MGVSHGLGFVLACLIRCYVSGGDCSDGGGCGHYKREVEREG